MTEREKYRPGAASAARVIKEGDLWTLVLVRELPHSPEKVWKALVEPDQLREWAPFDADGNLGTAGASVTLSLPGGPAEHAAKTTVRRAEAPRVLEYDWGGRPIKWELEATATGTRLTLWASIDRRYISMGAAGWHICLDVLHFLLEGNPIGRLTGAGALQHGNWQRLNQEYAQQFEQA
jgi:uncharacterized protein YndB with AHSA1/START domain